MPLPVFSAKALFATCAATFLASPAFAQDLPLGPRSDYGKVVLTGRQTAGQQVTLEQMFGGSFDSEPLHVYSAGSLYRELGKAVGRLDILTSKGTAFCTGFLISDKYLMTNHHCFNVEGATVQQASFLAGYLEEGIKDETQRFMVNTTPVEQDEDLDFAIVEVFGKPSADWGTLSLSALEFDPDRHAGHALFIIGHPQRLAQHISRKECRSAARKPVTSNRLRHTCDTLVGNSGSPIFDDENRVVVALHNSGSAKDGINFGIPISMIAQKSRIVASLVAPDPVQPNPPRPEPKQTAVNACDAALSKAQQSKDCADFDAYLTACTDHAMRPFVQSFAESLCKAPTPDLTLTERMAANSDVQLCDSLSGATNHPDKQSGVMLRDGTKFDDIVPKPAIAACDKALAAFPDHPRLLLNLGRAHDKAGNYAKALPAYRTAAELNDPVAQFNLGYLSANALGLPKSDTDAVAWYRKSADQGFPEAQRNLGWMYRNGRGVAQSDTVAAAWFRKAADLGDSRAQNSLGVMYRNGRGVAQSDADAVSWYRKAADQGYSVSQYNLGWMYAAGRGVAQSDALALAWYRKAADQGYAKAQNSLGVMYRNGRGVAQSDADAAAWYRKAADQGYSVAQSNLGWMYENGRGVTQSYADAVAWYRKAADQGYAHAQNNLGWNYESGSGVSRSDKIAAEWYRKAAVQGHALGQYNLGNMYYSGRGVTKSFKTASTWYKKAADQGLASAQYDLAGMYFRGEGVGKSEAKALGLLRKAAEQGLVRAQVSLAEAYELGGPVKKSRAEALKWYRRAAKQGNEFAKDMVKKLSQ